MNEIIEQNLSLFKCPVCKGGNLHIHSPAAVSCSACGHKYPVHEENILDLLPPSPTSKPAHYQHPLEKSFFDFYYSRFYEDPKKDNERYAWGAPESITPVHLEQKKKLVAQILSAAPSKDKIVCDVTGGAGWLSLPSAKEAKLVINADFEMRNLRYVMRKAKEEKIKNMLFVRADMFASPFPEKSMDIIFCTDTLIYGDYQVRHFLTGITESISAGGSAIVTFHNKRHRLPFRKPYVIGYSLGEIRSILSEIASARFSFESFYQEPVRWVEAFIPPTLYIARISGK